MTERNEQTSPDIASFAAKVMRMDDAEVVRQAYHMPSLFRSMAASLVTQAADKAKRDLGPEIIAQIADSDPRIEAALEATKATARTLDAWNADGAPKARKPRASKPTA